MSKKEQLIAEAQKFQQKGQIDKAVKCYRDAVAADPGDLKVRQRLAELFSRAERFDEAKTEFEVIGRNLSGNGFYLRAIAVYKQIEKLFPEDVDVILTLASLNEKHGLSGQAMAEYKRAFDLYEKREDIGEAINVLVAMEKADPQNINIRLKLAEVLFQSGNREESFLAFSDLAAMLVERGDEQSFSRLVTRIGQIFPDRPGFVFDVLQKQIEAGFYSHSLQFLHTLLKADPKKLRVWTLIVTAYDHLADLPKLKAASQHFMKFFPEEFLPKKHLASCLIAENDVDGALSVLESSERLSVDSNSGTVLKQLYASMLDIAPYDIRVLKAMARVCSATGDKEQADAISSKIVALSNISARPSQDLPEEPDFPDLTEDNSLQVVFEDEAVSFDSESEPEPASELIASVPEIIDEEPLSYGEISFGIDTDDSVTILQSPEAEAETPDIYEIEIDLDMGEEPVASQVSSNENWFETVTDIFDNIATEPGKVKFATGLEQGDAQSHFDLGMAFKEMGLLDEAINEFRSASSDPRRRVECLVLQGGCLRDKGELELAENALNSLLTAPGISIEERAAIKYELALTFEVAGRTSDASRLYSEIDSELPEFRDVKARLQQSSLSSDASDFDFSEDDLLDFDLK